MTRRSERATSERYATVSLFSARNRCHFWSWFLLAELAPSLIKQISHASLAAGTDRRGVVRARRVEARRSCALAAMRSSTTVTLCARVCNAHAPWRGAHV